jgi:hypothetical protein
MIILNRVTAASIIILEPHASLDFESSVHSTCRPDGQTWKQASAEAKVPRLW